MSELSLEERAEIAQTIVRTAYSRVYDCLSVLADQNDGLEEVKISQKAQARMINMIVQDFSCAHNPCNGSVALRHAKPSDKERDLEISSRFNTLGFNDKTTFAKSTFMHMVQNFNQSPAAQDIHFKIQ